MNKILTENTLIPISALTVFFAASAWMTTVYFQGEVNASQIQEVKAKYQADLDKVDFKLDKINDKLDRIIEAGTMKRGGN